MAGSSAFDGGRGLKSGVIAFGALMWAAPVFAQPQDPLAPLPSSPVPAPLTSQAAPATAQPAQPAPAPIATAPKDWRGVFDAIDAGRWSLAQAGIAALPPDALAPVAKAELYAARGSPVIDLASLQALIDQAPELPEAGQIALMAWKRG